MSFKNSLPKFSVQAALYGGLKYVIFLFLCFFFFLLLVFGLNRSLCVYPLLFSAAWYTGLASLKTCSLHEMLLNLLFTILGSSLVVLGGLRRMNCST